MPSERSRFSTPSAWLSAAPSRSGAKFVIASYTQHSHTITSPSVHQRARATEVREGAETGPTAIAEPVLLSIETAAGQAIDLIRRTSAQGKTGCSPRCESVSSTRGSAATVRRQESGRGVVVGVVQQQHRALPGAVGHARGDRRGRGPRLPVAAPVAPQQRAPAVRSRQPQRGGIERTVRRTVQADRAAGRPISIVSWARAMSARTCHGAKRKRLRWRSQCSPISCPAPTISPASAGLRRICSPTRKKVARTPAAARISEHRRSSLRVGTVVEGERVPAPARGASSTPSGDAAPASAHAEAGQQITCDRQPPARPARARGRAASRVR